MITINRENEVIIEDGMSRISVQSDGSGYIHENGSVNEVELLSPVYLKAARNAGMSISDEIITRSERQLDEEYFG